MKNIIIANLAILLMTGIVYAQTAAPGEVSVMLELADPENTTNADLGIDPNDPDEEITLPADYRVRIPIEVLDSTGIRKVHVQLGSTAGGTDYFDEEIDLEEDMNWPEDVYVRWSGNMLIMNLGIIEQVLDYYASIRFEDDAGGISIPSESTNISQ